MLKAAAQAGIGGEELERAVQDPAIKQRLRDAAEAAHAHEVFGVPTFSIDGELFWGDDRLEDAAAYFQRAQPT